MTKQQIIDEQNSELCALRRYVWDLKARHSAAIDALADLSSGYGIKDGTYNGAWENAMKALARGALARIAKMPLREVP